MRDKTSITTKCRLRCGECNAMRRVANVTLDSLGETIVTLKCNHTRGELLPLVPGRISLEHLSGKLTDIGLLMFPVCKGSFYE